MSQPPPSYPVPSGYPPGYPARPVKYRPSWVWFVVGGGLIVVAIVVAIGLFVWALAGFLDSDATVRADGRPHTVTVGTDGDRMLWLDDARQTCSITDLETGQPIDYRPVSGSFERNDSHGDLEGLYRFDPGSGHLRVQCDPAGIAQTESVLIGPMPKIGSFVLAIALGILIPGLLGLTGIVILLVTGILFATRQSRPKA
ncbi:hypothetical protein [Nocardioides mangrovi]|uniref:DUF3592 domain-containing protein n=1 Tax=Nocardioides mangrovi TaxID=2874580 RepID=A0ABS7U7X3_9ACTN|nr:hypothetical protein [Nocardioides mangrovi]MBZ5737041.1 hypothetical protein [Nocardioides mangrovi]